MGNLADRASVEIAHGRARPVPDESASGHPTRPIRACCSWHKRLDALLTARRRLGLGRIGDRRAAPTLLAVIGDLHNAIDTRHAAAEALARLRDPGSMSAIRKLAADYPEVSTRKVLLRICDN